MSDRVVCAPRRPPLRVRARASARVGCACVFRERRNSNRIRGRASYCAGESEGVETRARARGSAVSPRGRRMAAPARRAVRARPRFDGRGISGRDTGGKRGRATRERGQRPRVGCARAQAQAGTHHADTSAWGVGVGWGGGDALAGAPQAARPRCALPRHHRGAKAHPTPPTHSPPGRAPRGLGGGVHARTARARHQRRHRGRRREAPVPRGDGAARGRAGGRGGARRGEGARGRRGGAAADAVGRGGVPARPPGELHVPRTLRGAHPAASERASEREGNGETESHPPWHRLAVGVLSQCVGLSVARRT